MSTLVSPCGLRAVTVYVLSGAPTVGVPLMTPVRESRKRPEGKLGLTFHADTGPPPITGTSGVAATSFLKYAGFAGYESCAGASPALPSPGLASPSTRAGLGKPQPITRTSARAHRIVPTISGNG